MSKREVPLKTWALHQIEVKCLTLSNKTCLSENLSLKVQELCSNQILQTVAYIAHYHKDLASFLHPKPAKLVNKNWSKVAGHTKHSPKVPNKVFHKISPNTHFSPGSTSNEQSMLNTRGKQFWHIAAVMTRIKNVINQIDKDNSLSGDEICLDAWRQGSCEPFVNIIFEPVHEHYIRYIKWVWIQDDCNVFSE